MSCGSTLGINGQCSSSKRPRPNPASEVASSAVTPQCKGRSTILEHRDQTGVDRTDLPEAQTTASLDLKRQFTGGSAEQAKTLVADADELRGGSGNDLANGGTGDDRLWGDSGADTLFGGAANDQLLGGEGNDLLAGDPGDDRLDGGKVDEILQGNASNDKLLDGEADRRDCGTDVDVLAGGVVADCFVFNTGLAAHTKISDFECGIGRNMLSGLTSEGFDANAFCADGLTMDSFGGVLTLVGDLSIVVANQFGAADFATQA